MAFHAGSAGGPCRRCLRAGSWPTWRVVCCRRRRARRAAPRGADLQPSNAGTRALGWAPMRDLGPEARAHARPSQVLSYRKESVTADMQRRRDQFESRILQQAAKVGARQIAISPGRGRGAFTRLVVAHGRRRRQGSRACRGRHACLRLQRHGAAFGARWADMAGGFDARCSRRPSTTTWCNGRLAQAASAGCCCRTPPRSATGRTRSANGLRSRWAARGRLVGSHAGSQQTMPPTPARAGRRRRSLRTKQVSTFSARRTCLRASTGHCQHAVVLQGARVRGRACHAAMARSGRRRRRLVGLQDTRSLIVLDFVNGGEMFTHLQHQVRCGRAGTGASAGRGKARRAQGRFSRASPSSLPRR